MTLDDIIMLNEEKIKEESNNNGRYLKIRELLKDDAIFFKISANDALNILKYYFPKEKLKEVYTSLVSIENYTNLKEKFKL